MDAGLLGLFDGLAQNEGVKMIGGI